MKRQSMYLKISLIVNCIFLAAFLLIGYKLRTRFFHNSKSDETFKVVMLGTGYTAEANWNEYLNRKDVKNSGYSGFNSSQLDWILDDAVLKYKPSICFMGSGLNDIQVGVPLSRTFSNYRSIVEKLKENGVVPVLQGTFYIDYPVGTATNFPSSDSTKIYNQRIDSLNNYLSNLARAEGVKYIDLNEHLTSKGRIRSTLSEDGVHLNRNGFEIWANAVKEILAEEQM